jgi:DNA-binding MarR family transcriptional regulator
MSKAAKSLEKGGLVHLERLASILRGLTPEELETLEILLDRQASSTIRRALGELNRGEGIPLEKW